jgi:hypothetical protein
MQCIKNWQSLLQNQGVGLVQPDIKNDGMLKKNSAKLKFKKQCIWKFLELASNFYGRVKNKILKFTCLSLNHKSYLQKQKRLF